FSGCKSLKSIDLPDQLDCIETALFSHCTSLENVEIPAGVACVEGCAFEECTSLRRLKFPSQMTYFGREAFSGCTALEELTLPAHMEMICRSAFLHCEKMQQISIPDGVTYIGIGAFSGCSALSDVWIPVTVTEIDENPFIGCDSLSDIYYAGSDDQWRQILIRSKDTSFSNATLHFNSERIPDTSIPSYARPDVMDPSALFSSVTPELVLEYTALAKFGYSTMDGACIADSSMTQNQKDGGKLYLEPGSTAYSVREEVQHGRHCEFTNTAKDRIWDDRSATYTQFYSDLIGDYEVVAVMNRNKTSGLYAMCLRAPDGNYVISYRGSEGLHGDEIKKYLFDDNSASHDDWTSTDFKFSLESELSPQFDDALEFYNDVLHLYCGGDPSRLTLTGHSLGGSLAAYVSMITNARAYPIDGAVGHIVDLALYYGWAKASDFSGTDRFNFINLTDEEKQLAADKIQTTLAGYYPMNEYQSDRILHTTEQPAYFLAAAGSHHAMSYITYHEGSKTFTLNELARQYTTRSDFNLLLWTFRKPFSSHIGRIVLGTSTSDELSLIFPLADNGTENVMLGGTGDDWILGSLQNDHISAGSGNSEIYGMNGSDTYIVYRNNTGSVTITDPTGSDTILLCGWDVRPQVTVTYEGQEKVLLKISGTKQLIRVSLSRENNAKSISVKYRSETDGSIGTLISDIFAAAGISAAVSAGAQAMSAEQSTAIRLRSIAEAHVCDASGAECFVYQRSKLPVVNEYGQFYATEDGILVYLTDPAYHLMFTGEASSEAFRYLLDADGCITSVESYDADHQTLTVSEDGLHSNDELLSPKKVTVPVQKVELNQADLTMQLGESVTLKAVVTPADATDAVIHWQTSDDTVISVSADGTVHAERPGKAAIRAITNEGALALCDVTVTGDLTQQHAALSETEFVYDGAQHTPSVTVEGLTRDVDYEVTYENGTEIGPAYTVVTGIGAYTGELRLPYEVKSSDTPKPPVQANPFTDVSEVQYYYEPVLWAVNHEPQITNGTSANTFSPEAACTRGQVVTFLWRAMGCPEPKSTKNPFADVQPGDYFYKPVLWAMEQGITNGVDAKHFDPEGACTRAHVVTFLWRAHEKPIVVTANPFSD
ncbi:MAG: leucine-rich repeat protein, partial [Oscillospiraceae bacterium]|nr:leucine-rich repeat protein [Oscillospiraceae bacterium]